MNKFIVVIFLLISGSIIGQNTQYGTTIITHGFILGGTPPLQDTNWPYKMGIDIIARGGGQGCIQTYRKSTGDFVTVFGNCQSGEKVLIYDWAKESEVNMEGYSEAAGDALFAALMKRKGTLGGLHFIGHSRGTVVNTECVLRLLTVGLEVDHVTNLDPHDWGLRVSPGGTVRLSEDFDNHPELPGIPGIADSHVGVVAWSGVKFYDTYYQTNGYEFGPENCSCLLGLEGRLVAGTHNNLWNNFDGNNNICHTNIQECAYGKTILNISWTGAGYSYSRIAGGLRPNTNFNRTYPRFDFFTNKVVTSEAVDRIQGIVNGSFDRGSGTSIPGWEEHNSTPRTLRVTLVNETLNMVAYPNQDGAIGHNRFYVPKDAEYITFLRKNKVDYPGKLFVKINGNEEFSVEFDQQDIEFTLECVNVSAYQDQIIDLTFRLESTGPLFSDILIDEVKLSTTGCSTHSTLFLFDMSGSMSDHGGGTIPKMEQAKAAGRSTLQSMQNSGPGIVNEVAVYGFEGGCREDPTTEIFRFGTDLNAAEASLARMQPGGGTPLGKAIRAAECKLADHLSANGQTDGKFILLSDGQGTCGNIRPGGVYNSAPLQTSRYTIPAGQCGTATANTPLGVKYYTVGLNIPPGSAAERDLQYLSQLSGGKYLNVQNQTQLTRAFRKFNRIYQPKEQPALLNLPPSTVASFRAGVQEIKREEFADALPIYEAFAQENPTDCHGAYNLALTAEANDYFKLAMENYRRYLSLCPQASDQAFVQQQITFLEEEYSDFVAFQKQVVESDLAFLKLHFERIQNGQSVALAMEFRGFLQEKGDYYSKLPRLIDKEDRFFVNQTEDITQALERCSTLIRRKPETWDRDAIPIISLTYLNLQDLLAEM